MPGQILTQSYVKSRFHYSDGKIYHKKKTSNERDSKRWNSRFSGKEAGCKDKNGYIILCLIINGKQKNFKAHRIIYLMHYGFIPEFIDHIDQNPSNNEISNLRSSNNPQNQRNRKIGKNNTSGCIGVSYYPRLEKFRSSIHSYGNYHNLGFFCDFFQAVCARKSAEIKYGFHKNHGNK